MNLFLSYDWRFTRITLFDQPKMKEIWPSNEEIITVETWVGLANITCHYDSSDKPCITLNAQWTFKSHRAGNVVYIWPSTHTSTSLRGSKQSSHSRPVRTSILMKHSLILCLLPRAVQLPFQYNGRLVRITASPELSLCWCCLLLDTLTNDLWKYSLSRDQQRMVATWREYIEEHT